MLNMGPSSWGRLVMGVAVKNTRRAPRAPCSRWYRRLNTLVRRLLAPRAPRMRLTKLCASSTMTTLSSKGLRSPAAAAVALPLPVTPTARHCSGEASGLAAAASWFSTFDSAAPAL